MNSPVGFGLVDSATLMLARLHYIGFVFEKLAIRPLTWHLMKHTLKFHMCMWSGSAIVSHLGRSSLFMGSRPQKPFDPPSVVTLEIVKG